MNVNDYLTEGWIIFSRARNRGLANIEQKDFRNKWDILGEFDSKIVETNKIYYVVVIKKTPKKNPVGKEHIYGDIADFRTIEKKAKEIGELTVSLRKKDEKELEEMKTNPKKLYRIRIEEIAGIEQTATIKNVWCQFKIFVKAGIYENLLSDWVKYAGYYGFSLDKAREYWKKEIPKTNPIIFKPMPPIYEGKEMEQHTGLVIYRTPAQSIEYLDKYVLITKSFPAFRPPIKLIIENIKTGAVVFEKIIYRKYQVVFEDGETDILWDFQISPIEFESSLEREVLEKVEKGMQLRSEKMEIDEKKRIQYLDKWRGIAAKEAKETYERYKSLFSERKKIQPEDITSPEYSKWLNEVLEILKEAEKHIEETKLIAMLQGLGYDARSESIEEKRKKIGGSYKKEQKWYKDRLFELSKSAPAKDSLIEYSRWLDEVNGVIELAERYFSKAELRSILKQLGYQ